MKAEKEFMQKAIEAAEKSSSNGDYAIGSIVVRGNEILSIGYETLKSDNDPVNGHAEIDAIRKVCKKLNQPYLEGCVLYSTHEPCPMCISAIYWAKAKGIVFSVSRNDMVEEMKKRKGGKFSWRQIEISCENILDKGSPNLNIEVIGGFMKEECINLLDLTNQND